MVESRRCAAFVGMVADKHGTSLCRQPTLCRSRFDPCMAGWFGVGRLACGLFIVWSFFLQQFGWYPAGSATLWSACAFRGRLRRTPRHCGRVLSWLSSRLLWRFVESGLSDVAVMVRPGQARRVVLVRRRRYRQWLARPGLCAGLFGPVRPRLVAVGCPLRYLFPVGVFCRGSPGCGVSACEVVVL